jgi:phenylacetate-CoA ligase
MVENLLLPVYDIARRTSRFRSGRTLRKTQWLPREEIERLQTKNLRTIVRHAYETVPYYRRVFREKGLSPSDIKNVDDLVKLPTISKANIRENFQDFLSRSFPRNRLVPYTSGGSGDQIKFYLTKEQLSWEIAAEYRAYDWAGYRLGDRCFLFWGSPIDLAKHRKLAKRITRNLERIFIADTYVISIEVLDRFAQQLESFNPEIVRGYTTSVYMMAKHLLERGVDSVRPRAVITTAETLFDSMRKTIEDAFGCPVFDYYGSREVGALAAECEEHSGYHISAENVVMEFVRDDEHVDAGEKGVITLTSLRNFGMPFIRYKIGDVGTPFNEGCPCGRGLPLMSSIEGRVSEFLAAYDKKSGSIVPVGPVYPVFILALMHLPLESVRVTQESLDKVVFRAVKAKNYSHKDTDFLIDYFHKVFGDNIEIEVEFVDSLPPLPSGKRSVFISKINPFEPQSVETSEAHAL